MKIVVIGGSGLIGKKVVPILRGKGHEVVAASPSTGVNAVTGEGLAQALAGANVVVDVANAPSWEDEMIEVLRQARIHASAQQDFRIGSAGMRNKKSKRRSLS